MSSDKNNWLTREQAFAAFATGPLLDFWHQREEQEFTGVEDVTIRYVRFTAPQHNKVILLVPGRIETYVKYPEVAYDLYHCGYDVIVVDHRGQGRSDRLLDDAHRGHVVQFEHYVTDLERLCELELSASRYQHRYALAHSMGAAILTLLLARRADLFAAVVLSSPMFGICLPMPAWMAHRILNWAEKRPTLRDGYAPGTGRWRAYPFGLNQLTHSYARYKRNLRFYADEPALRVGGPTYHWVREGLLAGQSILSVAASIVTPLLLLQAGKDRIVDNRAQDLFCRTMAAAGQPCAGGKPHLIAGARHEILFEKDAMRAEALYAIVNFFARHE